MRVWITGATGFVGGALLRRCLARGDEVVALVRPGRVLRAVAQPRLRVAVGELPDIGAFAHEPGPHVVFHCAAAIGGAAAESHLVHVDGTLRLALAAPEARFVHLSTTDVLLAQAADAPVAEDALCGSSEIYGRTKLAGERALLNARPDAVVLRPPGVYGPGSKADVVLGMTNKIERGRFFLIGDGLAVRSWVYVETLVDAMLHVAAQPDLAGIFHVDDGRSVSRRELAREIARALGRPSRFLRVPVPVARAGAFALERAFAPLRAEAPLTARGVQFCTTGLPLDTSKLRATGFVPRFTVREAIATTVDAIRQTRPRQQRTWGASYAAR